MTSRAGVWVHNRVTATIGSNSEERSGTARTTAMATEERSSLRRIIQAEAIEWLAHNPADATASVVTSLPDISELPHLGFERWQAWFVETASTVLRWTPEQGIAVFFQSDILWRGRWLDKAHLILQAVDRVPNASLLWHKIVCRKAPGTPSQGRASYSHMLCASRGEPRPARHPWPDVLPAAGHMPWPKAMGVAACELACRYIRQETASSFVVDPFCGYGTVLAVANALGLDSLGLDTCRRRCKAARSLVVELPAPCASAQIPSGT